MPYRKYVLLVSVLVVSLLLLTLQIPGQAAWGPGEFVSWFTIPAQVLVTKAHRSALGLWSTYRSWQELRAENRALHTEAERLRVESLQAAEIREENSRLRRLLALKERLPLETLSGEVIGKEWGGWVRSLTVNRGRNDGVGRLTAVIVPGGLVGRVVTVRANAAVIQLLNDPASSVGAVVQRTRAQGLVEGAPGGGVRFKFLARASAGVQVGDLIVTSGVGGLFPRGLPVGRVSAVEDRVSGLFGYAGLAPVVDFSRVEEVLLLVSQSAADLGAHFASR
ncbi:MAG: rod shape-determining protein MreC [Candidatus Rokubacteria bacterium]|nr:rod shape-determining protein MreC [Candidatus Rokubacteria bacterium]